MSEQPSPWAAGYAAFAGIMLVIGGVFQAIAGLVAIVDDEFLVVGQDYIFKFDTTTWGWIHLIWGLIVLASGFGIFSGNVLARTVGVVAASVAAIIAFAWLPYSPWWSIVLIALNIAIIWALTVHGRDLSEI